MRSPRQLANAMVSILAIIIATPCAAHGRFEATALSDVQLDTVRGTYDPASFALTVASLKKMQDDFGQDSFRLVGSVANISMDSWWASFGSDLIAASVASRP